MAEPSRTAGASVQKAERRAARELVAAYHRDELRTLLEHVRDGFARLDAGEIDEFDLDDVIHRYKRAAAKQTLSADDRAWLEQFLVKYRELLDYLRDH